MKKMKRKKYELTQGIFTVYTTRTGHRSSLYQMILIGQLLMIETVHCTKCTLLLYNILVRVAPQY